jgi:Na+/phosphate symporter
MWPDLSAFPPWINTVAGALFALGVAGVTLAAFFGRLRGALQPPDPGAGTAQIAMMSLDSTAIREHTAAVQVLATEMHQLGTIGREYLESLEQRQEEAELRDAEQRGYERAQAERVRAPRKVSLKRGALPDGGR